MSRPCPPVLGPQQAAEQDHIGCFWALNCLGFPRSLSGRLWEVLPAAKCSLLACLFPGPWSRAWQATWSLWACGGIRVKRRPEKTLLFAPEGLPASHPLPPRLPKCRRLETPGRWMQSRARPSPCDLSGLALGGKLLESAERLSRLL